MKDASCTIMNPRGKRKVKSNVLIFIQVKKMIVEVITIHKWIVLS